MDLEQIIQVLIYTHAALGGIALISGAIALIVSKGSDLHQTTGKVFFYSMLVSALISFVIAVMPNHQNSFLFSIGLFSIYFLISGLRSIGFKQQDHNFTFDKILAVFIIITGIVMVLYPILTAGVINIILTVFGVFGAMFGVRDLYQLRDTNALRKLWLQLHLGKITGGYIAAVSAFFVVNNILPGIWNWFTPGIMGGFYIAYWIRKVSRN